LSLSRRVINEKMLEDSHVLVLVCNVQEYLKLRTAHVNSLKAAGDSPYPHKFVVTISLTEFIEKYCDVNDGEQHADVVSVAGEFSTICSTVSTRFCRPLSSSCVSWCGLRSCI